MRTLPVTMHVYLYCRNCTVVFARITYFKCRFSEISKPCLVFEYRGYMKNPNNIILRRICKPSKKPTAKL